MTCLLPALSSGPPRRDHHGRLFCYRPCRQALPAETTTGDLSVTGLVVRPSPPRPPRSTVLLPALSSGPPRRDHHGRPVCYRPCRQALPAETTTGDLSVTGLVVRPSPPRPPRVTCLLPALSSGPPRRDHHG